MKKLLFVFGIVLALVSCGDTKYYSVSITNSSADKSVSYTYNGISDTLAVSETKTYEVEAYTQSPKNIVDQNGVASLTVKTNSMTGDYTFSDATPLELNVINRLPVNITIKADNYIDNSGSTEVTIASNNESTGAKIYTKNPKFTTTTDYPIIVEYTVNGNKMSVIIR